MTNKSVMVAMGLIVLTLTSFALVSGYVSTPVKHSRALSATPSPRPPAGIAPLATATPSPSNRPPASERQMYADLGQAQTLLDDLSNVLLANDWPRAASVYNQFLEKTQKLPTPQLNEPDFSPVMQDFFTLYRVELARALNEQNAGNARFAVNQLYGIVGEQRARLGSRGMPLELVRLNFLVREVALCAQLNNEPLLRERQRALRETWQEMRPVILARRNGRETATHFDQLVEQLSNSTPASDPAAIVAECHKDLAQMDALFRRPTTRATAPPNNPAKPASDEDEDD